MKTLPPDWLPPELRDRPTPTDPMAMWNEAQRLRRVADEVFRAGRTEDAALIHDAVHQLERKAQDDAIATIHMTPPSGVVGIAAPSLDDHWRAMTTHFMTVIVGTVRIASSDMTDEQCRAHYKNYARDIYVFASELASLAMFSARKS